MLTMKSSSFRAISLFMFISILFFTTSKIVILSICSSSPHATESDPTDVNHLVFGIASTRNSWPNRKQYAKLWWNKRLKGCVFVDNLPHEENDSDDSAPPLCVSEDTSKFHYTYKGGLRSAIRVARVVKEIVGLNNHSNVRWYVFLRVQETFKPWKENLPYAGIYTFSTTKIHQDPCERPAIFYLNNVSSGKDGVISNYTKSFRECANDKISLKNLEVIIVVTNKLELDTKQLESPRRQCCDVLQSNSDQVMEIAIRECKYEELIYMHW